MDSQRKNKLLNILSSHARKNRAIPMRDLYHQLFGEWPEDKINATRPLRHLITELRNDGIPICHSSDAIGGGYYLASGGRDLADHCDRIHARAMKLLVMEARLRKGGVPGLMGQISMR